MSKPGDLITLEDRVNELIEFYEGLRRASKILGVHPSYLSRLRHGKKQNPSKRLLDKLHIRISHYVRT